MNAAGASVTKGGQAKNFPYYVKALALGIPAILIGFQLSGWIFILPAIVNGHSDFRQLYSAGYMLRAGHRQALYDYASQIAFQNSLVSPEEIALPFNHLAYEGLLFVPFSFLPYHAAWLAFFVVNLLLLVLCYRLLRPHLDRLALVYRWLPAVMFISFLPIGIAFMQQQDSIILLSLITATTCCLLSRREFQSGILLGLGCFKFHLVVPVALLFLFSRRWRISAGFLLSAVSVGVLSLWLVGPKQFSEYVHWLAAMSTHTTPMSQLKYGIFPFRMPNLRGLVYGLLGRISSRFVVQFVTFASSATTLAWAAIKLRTEVESRNAVSIAIAAAAAVSYHLYIHDMAVLLIPILLTLDNSILAEAYGPPADRQAARASAAMFIAPGLIAIAPLHLYLACLPLLALLITLAGHRSEVTTRSIERQGR